MEAHVPRTTVLIRCMRDAASECLYDPSAHLARICVLTFTVTIVDSRNLLESNKK